MWYTRRGMKKKINYAKPIIAESRGDGTRYLLLPLKDRTHKFTGYDWFNLEIGKYNSNLTMDNPIDAIEMYSDYLIYNADIQLNKL